MLLLFSEVVFILILLNMDKRQERNIEKEKKWIEKNISVKNL